MLGLLLAVALLSAEKGGIAVAIESDTPTIDPARSTFLSVRVTAKPSVPAAQPDLRDRIVGFSLAEDFAEEPTTGKDGSVTSVVNWKLVPEPCAETYKIRPFVVGDQWFGPVTFEPPPAREAVTGGIEIDPKKDLPPLSWKLVGWCALALAGIAAVVAAVGFGVRYLARRVKEHRMSPVERAWVELDRLMKKGLPGRGRYKDFYVELTQVVRRYVQRQHGVKAPHLTTEEFFEVTKSAATFPKETLAPLMEFLTKADLVKFAGVEATPETADDATEGAKSYIAKDNEIVGKCHLKETK